MESEKVKEIKKALECCANVKQKCDNKNCYLFDKLEHPYCERQLKKDLLTLINELESENERLSEQRNKIYNIWVKDTEQLKDRIAELEKEKKEHGKKKFLRGWKLGIEEFAARLKESAGQSYVSQNGVRISNITYSISDGTINKILKEILCEK